MNFNKFLLLLFAIVIFFPLVSSAHYIIGYVNDALDGTSSEEYTIFMWNPTYGLEENLIDSIGLTGNSSQEGMYKLDCENLIHGCSLGDVLSLTVIDNGDNYITNVVNVTVTSNESDWVDNLTLNSPPSINLISPLNNGYLLNPAKFNCSFSDLDGPSGNLSLWGNFSGVWQESQRYEVSEGNLDNTFFEILQEGEFLWNCASIDNLGISTWGENRTVTIDLTKPAISFLNLNKSLACGNESIELICNTFDNYQIANATLQIQNPSNLYNLTMNYLSGNNYSRDILINQSGNWVFTCFSNDLAGNFKTLGINLTAYSGYPELYINSSNIIFSKQDPIEGELINISALIENKGCVDSSNFAVSFFKEHPSFGNQLGSDFILSLSSFSSNLIKLPYSSWIGKNNVFVFVDKALEIFELNETDNINNNSIDVPLWQDFYGNVSAVKILSSFENFSSWSIDEQVVGNIFVTDSESKVDWFSLKAIGKDVSNQDSLNDFSEIDLFFGTSNLEDSIQNEYLYQGVVRDKSNFIIHQEIISEVPIINSTDSNNFVTGILWDVSDDTDGKFGSIDKEDLVFVTKLNNNAQGKYGIYDYEIKVPVELRSYDLTETSEVYFYYNLV